MRTNNRKADELRPIQIIKDYIPNADTSVLISCGNTKLICTASLEEQVPPFLKGSGDGWVTAEYAMLPSATGSRNKRDHHNNGRSKEISRLIGRSLRSSLDLTKLGERQIIIDCDVINADGGTRVTAITGGFLVLQQIINKLLSENKITKNPILNQVAAISVGIVNGELLLDLDYLEDSSCDSDINVVMLDDFNLVELQATAEQHSFSKKILNELLELAEHGIKQIFSLQNSYLD